MPKRETICGPFVRLSVHWVGLITSLLVGQLKLHYQIAEAQLKMEMGREKAGLAHCLASGSASQHTNSRCLAALNKRGKPREADQQLTV